MKIFCIDEVISLSEKAEASLRDWRCDQIAFSSWVCLCLEVFGGGARLRWTCFEFVDIDAGRFVCASLGDHEFDKKSVIYDLVRVFYL